MELMITGLLIFFGLHLIPSLAALRASLVGMLGEKGFKAVFALISLAGMALIVIGKGDAEFTTLYEPPEWGRHVTSLLVLVALYFLISSEVKSSIRTVTAHPMLWGISAWAAGHLLANGDVASVLLFASFLVYSLFAMASANRRGAKPSGSGMAVKQDGIVLVLAALIYIGLMFFHATITGVPIME